MKLYAPSWENQWVPDMTATDVKRLHADMGRRFKQFMASRMAERYKEFIMVQVELSDLEQIAFALDDAITNSEPQTEGLLLALETVQGYIDDAATVQSEGSDTDSDSTELEDGLFEDDIPF